MERRGRSAVRSAQSSFDPKEFEKLLSPSLAPLSWDVRWVDIAVSCKVDKNVGPASLACDQTAKLEVKLNQNMQLLNSSHI